MILAYMLSIGFVHAEGFVLGIGATGDSEDGRSVTAFGEIGVGENTWLSATAGRTETDAVVGGFATGFVDAGIDHWFGPLGIRLAGAYWGDSDILDSVDINSSVYFRNNAASLSVDYERRNFDFVFDSVLLQERRTAEFHADGWGLSARIRFAERFSIHVGGMRYDYSRNIRIQPNIDSLRFLSASRLSLVNSLIDHRLSAGLEIAFGLRSLDLTIGNWQTAIDGGEVDSFGIGFVTPMTDRTDIEFRLSFDDAENFGRSTALSVNLYYFGGS